MADTPPTAVSTVIAKGVTAVLQAASTGALSKSFTVERCYYPEHETSKLKALTLYVADLAGAMEDANREDDQFDHVIRVAIGGPVAPVRAQQLIDMDAMAFFRQEVLDLLRDPENQDQGEGTLMEASVVPNFDPTLLIEHSVFYCNLTLTYRVFR